MLCPPITLITKPIVPSIPATAHDRIVGLGTSLSQGERQSLMSPALLAERSLCRSQALLCAQRDQWLQTLGLKFLLTYPLAVDGVEAGADDD